jgi:tRNA G10  N-methylase Trm11
MEYLLRFIQVHETFRLPEIEALSELEGVPFEVVEYSLDVHTPSSANEKTPLTPTPVTILYNQSSK